MLTLGYTHSSHPRLAKGAHMSMGIHTWVFWDVGEKVQETLVGIRTLAFFLNPVGSLKAVSPPA